MNKDIAEYVAKYPNCQQVKVEHLKLEVLPQIIEVLNWKWEDINMDSLLVSRELGYSMTPYRLLWTN